MKLFLLIALMATLALALTGCTDGGSSSGGGTVTTVTDANGNPITIVSNRGNDGEATTLTDSNGNPITTVD